VLFLMSQQNTPAGISIRPALECDRAFVSGLVSSLLEYGSPAWEDAGALAPGFSAALGAAVSAQDQDSTVLIAEGEDMTPLGFISIKVKPDVTGVDRAHVADLAVIDGARRRGIGTLLMKAAESWAGDRGLSVLSLDVWSTNARAMSFYRGLGYAPESLCLIKRLDDGSE
jgi:ribosomal protein S18 acetylase RimI-like enzyme